MVDVRGKWTSRDAAEHYLRGRWRSARRAGRDLALVRRALRRHGIQPAAGFVLDAPCGTGRLAGLFSNASADPGIVARRYVGLDVAAAMLERAPPARGRALVRGDVLDLPFQSRSFPLVVTCRFLHHLQGGGALARSVAELVRVSSAWVVASFWDEGSLPALRRRVGWSAGEGPGGRRARSRAELESAFTAAGAAVVGFEHGSRLFSQQCFAVARVG